MSAAIDLEAIRQKFLYDCSVSTTPASKDLYQRLADLTAEVIRRTKPPIQSDEQPIPDLITNLQVEITNLKQQVAMLSEMGRIVEDTRTALRQREDAPEVDKTAARLPNWAATIMAQLDKLTK